MKILSMLMLYLGVLVAVYVLTSTHTINNQCVRGTKIYCDIDALRH